MELSSAQYLIEQQNTTIALLSARIGMLTGGSSDFALYSQTPQPLLDRMTELEVTVGKLSQSMGVTVKESIDLRSLPLEKRVASLEQFLKSNHEDTRALSSDLTVCCSSEVQRVKTTVIDSVQDLFRRYDHLVDKKIEKLIGAPSLGGESNNTNCVRSSPLNLQSVAHTSELRSAHDVGSKETRNDAEFSIGHPRPAIVVDDFRSSSGHCASTSSVLPCSEFLKMAAESKRRLPHLQMPPIPPLMITNPFYDPESDTSSDDRDAFRSDCTSELPSENCDVPINFSERELSCADVVQAC